MSFTTAQATAFMAKPEMKASGDGAHVSAETFCACVNNLAEVQGVNWMDLFAKAMAIYAIVNGPGTLTEKIAAIFALFNKQAGPEIVAG